MGKRKKKSSSQDDRPLKTIILATAILNLIKTLIDLISILIE